MKINYHIAIRALIMNSDRFSLITNKKNESVLNYLGSIKYDHNDEDFEFPDIAKIVENVGLPRNKVYPILYDSYLSLLDTFTNNMKVVRDCTHVIWIRNDDIPKDASKEYRERESKMHVWAEFSLPVIPRIGETIRLNFIDHNLKYYHGVVTEIEHEIDGVSQRVIITVDPLNNYYHQWQKLKDEYLSRERWLREIRSRNYETETRKRI